MATELKVRSIKISDATWERWRALAGDAGVTALISKCVDGYPELEAELARLRMNPVNAARLSEATKSADPGSSKMVAQVLPVTGTQFPKQLTHWQKQAAAEARQKPGKDGR